MEFVVLLVGVVEKAPLAVVTLGLVVVAFEGHLALDLQVAEVEELAVDYHDVVPLIGTHSGYTQDNADSR